MDAFHETLERWMAGERLPGIERALNERVEVVDGPHAGARGEVVAAVAFAPEPVFVVDLDAGTDVEVAQSALRCVD